MKSTLDDFKFDVFISHSAKDKTVVRSLAERLQADGLRVWFDEWVLKPGESIPSKNEDGHTISDFGFVQPWMSAQTFGSDWTLLEASTFRFRDPLNGEHRFLLLRLDDASIKGSLTQFFNINWRADKSTCINALTHSYFRQMDFNT